MPAGVPLLLGAQGQQLLHQVARSAAALLPCLAQQRQLSSAAASSSSGASSSTSSASASASSSGQAPLQQQPALAAEVLALRARIFEHHVGDGRRSGRKAILRPLKGRHVASWYFTLTGPKVPMMTDDLEEERILRTQVARATGSGPPKKGQGKRSGKR